MTRSRQTPGYVASRHAALAILCSFAAVPFFWMVWLSLLAPHAAASLSWTGHWPEFGAAENYRRAATETPLLRFALNGAIVCAAAVALHIATGAPAAFALAKLRVPGARLILSGVLVAMLIPREVIAIPLFVGFYGVRLLDSYAALILPNAVSPLTIFLLYQVFRTVPDDYVHAARLDGMSDWSIVWRVMLPLAAPTVATIAILTVIGRWNDLFWPSTVVTSMQLMPPPMGILMFRDQEAGSDYGPLMAAAILVVTPLLAGFVIAQQRFIDSFTAALPR
jgi:multiple sugar transport system permease protein